MGIVPLFSNSYSVTFPFSCDVVCLLCLFLILVYSLVVIILHSLTSYLERLSVSWKGLHNPDFVDIILNSFTPHGKL